MPDRFEDMRTFAAVVQTRSFGAAAIQLGIVKSAISRRVRELEDRLGTRLLDRTTRQFRLTDAGTAFYDRCVALLAAVDEAEDAASQGGVELAGRLRISGPMSFGIHCLTAAICAFQADHPRIAIELELDDRLIDVVREGFRPGGSDQRAEGFQPDRAPDRADPPRRLRQPGLPAPHGRARDPGRIVGASRLRILEHRAQRALAVP